MTLPSDDPLAKEQDKYVVRFPEGMRDQIKAAAKQNKRSLNAEIVARLHSTMAEMPTGLQDADLERLATRIAEKLQLLLPKED